MQKSSEKTCVLDFWLSVNLKKLKVGQTNVYVLLCSLAADYKIVLKHYNDTVLNPWQAAVSAVKE